MTGEHELELRLVVAEGILDADEARAQAAEAARAGQGLLERLKGSGRISEPTFASLRARVVKKGTVGDRAGASKAWGLAVTVPGGLPSADPGGVSGQAITVAAGGGSGQAITVAGSGAGPALSVAAGGVSGQAVTVAGGPSAARWRSPESEDLPPVGTSWPSASGSSDPDAFPVPGWERYTPIRLLGQGGMGRVFLAHDNKLDRNVAIKFVRGDDPELVRIRGRHRNE